MRKNERITDARNIAKLKNGECLSDSCAHAFVRLKWKCDMGHEWEAVFNNVRNGHWCPVCSGCVKKTIEDAMNLAKSKGGECLSKIFSYKKEKLLWECAKGHVWEATYQSVTKHWCPFCSGSKKYTLNDVFNFIKIYEGKCLSEKYGSNLEFECKYGHNWTASFFQIKRGSWCPICSIGLSERIVKIYFESLFGFYFKKIRPKWLSVNGSRLELDGYCCELNLAFEHNGIQHYSVIDTFKMNDVSLQKIIENDINKINLCEKRGIKLVVIPLLFSKLKIENLKNYIKKECIRLEVTIPENFDEIEVNITDAYLKFDKYLLEAKEIIKQNNGKFLSADFENCNNCNIKINYECDNKHVNVIDFFHLKYGRWCANCAGNKKYTINDAKDLAKIKNGECLSDVYINNNSKLEWKCEFGHTWSATFSNVKNANSWCPKCAICKHSDYMKKDKDKN